MNRRQLFASSLVLLWLLAAGGYLYSLEAPRWRPFIPNGAVGGDPVRSDLAQFDGAALRRTSGWQTPGHIAIVHFYDARCACSAASLQHIEDLQRRYGARVDQYIFSNDLAQAKQLPARRLAALPTTALADLKLSIPSSPAVAVWDEHGALAYFGPYSNGPICGTDKDFVSVTMDALLRGENPGLINTMAVGCFCPWHRNEPLGA